MRRLVGLMLIGVMLASLLGYYAATPPQPLEPIIENPTEEQEFRILAQGGTLVKLFWDRECEKCKELKAYLEDLVLQEEFEQKLFLGLVEINATYPKAIVSSQWRLEPMMLEDFNQTQIFTAICEFLNPEDLPSECME